MEPIGPYEVVREVGRGGMGVVFEGRAPGGARVAIKQLLVADRESQERFNRERRLLSSFTLEEGFVPLLDAGTSPRGPYLVMPFMEGGTLAGRLRGGPLPVSEAIALGRRLAGALGKAHAKNIVHRDMKPANVLFQGAVPLVADLGIAKHFRRDPLAGTQSASLSVTGEFMGSPGYAAPEQIDDPKSVGPAADVFALGSILYECLAGRPAFAGVDRYAAIARTATAEVAPISKHREGVPGWLDEVVLRALEKNPRNRYPDGNALFVALRGGRSRSALPLVLAALFLGGAAALVAYTAWPGSRESHPPPPGTPAPIPVASAAPLPVTAPRPQLELVPLEEHAPAIVRASIDPESGLIFAAGIFKYTRTLVLDMEGNQRGSFEESGTVVDPFLHLLFSSTCRQSNETVVREAQTQKEIRRVSRGHWCGGFLDVDSETGYVYDALECGNDAVAVFDRSEGGERVIPMDFASVDSVLVDPGSHQAYVSRNTNSSQPRARLRVIGPPPDFALSDPVEDVEAVAVDTPGHRVIARSLGKLAFVSTGTGSVERKDRVDFALGPAACDSRGQRIFLGRDLESAVVTVLDARTLDVLQKIDFERLMTPTALCLSPDGTTLYVFLSSRSGNALGIVRFGSR